jgi:membrane protease subunit (stomatin/prohibitin family)
LAQSLSIAEDRALKLLLSMEEQGTIPAGSIQALTANEPDDEITAPQINVEVTATKTEKMAADIKEKAAATQVFTGEIESKQTLCPQCGKPAGEGKFCNNCGAPLGLIQCPKCGAKSQAGTRFCGECGSKLG